MGSESVMLNSSRSLVPLNASWIGPGTRDVRPRSQVNLEAAGVVTFLADIHQRDILGTVLVGFAADSEPRYILQHEDRRSHCADHRHRLPHRIGFRVILPPGETQATTANRNDVEHATIRFYEAH